MPQSIGPAYGKAVQKSIKNILENAYSVAFRDEASKIFINKLNVSSNSRFVPDLVYSLQPNVTDSVREKTVGVALYHSYAEDKKRKILPFTMNNLTLEIDDLLDRGYSVKIIPMDNGDEEYSQLIYKNLQSDKIKKRNIQL